MKSHLSLFLGTRRLERALFICLAEALYSLVGLSPVSAAERPNIVFMMADDHTSQAWSCYGGRLAAIAKTPNIDRLAAEGALLKNCFCVNSICVPSRASILTGQYSHRNGVKTLRDALPPTSDNVAKRLQQAGYQTALVGKWHLKRKEDDLGGHFTLLWKKIDGEWKIVVDHSS